MENITAVQAWRIELGRKELKAKYYKILEDLTVAETNPEYLKLVAQIEEYIFNDDYDNPAVSKLEDQLDAFTSDILDRKTTVENECTDFLIAHVSQEYERIRDGFTDLNKVLKILFE